MDSTLLILIGRKRSQHMSDLVSNVYVGWSPVCVCVFKSCMCCRFKPTFFKLVLVCVAGRAPAQKQAGDEKNHSGCLPILVSIAAYPCSIGRVPSTDFVVASAPLQRKWIFTFTGPPIFFTPAVEAKVQIVEPSCQAKRLAAQLFTELKAHSIKTHSMRRWNNCTIVIDALCFSLLRRVQIWGMKNLSRRRQGCWKVFGWSISLWYIAPPNYRQIVFGWSIVIFWMYVTTHRFQSSPGLFAVFGFCEKCSVFGSRWLCAHVWPWRMD